MIQFKAYRLLLVINDNTLFHNSKTKEEYFEDVLDSLKENRAIFTIRRTKYIFYLINEMYNGVYLLELAREETQKIPTEGKNRVEEKSVIKTPFIYVIIDKKRQIVLIQEKSNVFVETEDAAQKIIHYMRLKLQLHYIRPNLDPMTDSRSFWSIVETADSISEFDITLRGKNLFKGRQKAEDLVEEISDEFNATDFEIKLRNQAGKLKLLYDNVKDFITLAATGGGKFMLKYYKDGQRFVKKSYDFIRGLKYNVEKPEDISIDQLDDDLYKLDNENNSENTK